MKHSIFTRCASLLLILALAAGLLPSGAMADAANSAGSAASSLVQGAESEEEPAVSEAESAASAQSQVPLPESAASSEPSEAALPGASAAPEMSAAPEISALPEASAAPAPEPPEETLQPETQESVQPHTIVIPEEPGSYTCTLQFYDGENLWSEQVLSSGETPLEPPAPTKENAVFEGWFDESGNACDFAKAVGVLSENQTIRYTARFAQNYIVYYFSQPEGGSVLFTQVYTSIEETVRWQEVAFAAPAGKALAGWSLTPGGQAVQAPSLTEEPLCLYPVLVNACWITPKGQGGVAPNPQYVLPGQPAPEIEPATRQGYQFTGWFLDEACTEPYTPGQAVNADLTVYAGWKAQNVVYRIAYWQQNPDDDGYSLAEVEQKTALADSKVQPDPAQDRYANFTLKERPVAQTIAGDGCTVIPVYYDRNIYEVKFYRASFLSTTLIPELTIKARYGANIADQWPSKVSDKWPDQWRTTPSGNRYQSGIVTMPAPNDSDHPNTFYYVEESGRYQHELRYYLETLQGGQWELDHTDRFKSSSTSWKLSENDCYEIKGFTLNEKKTPKMNSTEKDLGNNIYGFEIYYDRNDYEIQFYSAGELLKTETLPYESPLEKLEFTPTHPSDKDLVFAGWYTNNLGQGEPFDFSGTMPAGSFALYALWKEPTYRVSFDLAGGTAPEGADFSTQTVLRGELAAEPEQTPVREGWQFLGWGREGVLFNFLTPIRQNTRLTALWASEKSYRLSYEPGKGTGKGFSEEKTFGEGTLVQLAQPDKNWQPPEGSTGFLGWSVSPDGEGELFAPGSSFAMPGQDVVLYAQWAGQRTVNLTYDYNGGADTAGATEKTVEIEQPNQPYTIEDLQPEREGYLLTGWSRTASGGTLLKAGQTIRVNTLQPETNRLYAQWEKAVITEVRLVVGGNMGEKNRDFAFTADFGQNAGASFTLRHGGSYAFDPQPESAPAIAVQQEDVSADGYQTTVSEEMQDGRRIITYTNTRDVEIPTGIGQDSVPGIAVLALGGALLGAVGILRRKRL